MKCAKRAGGIDRPSHSPVRFLLSIDGGGREPAAAEVTGFRRGQPRLKMCWLVQLQGIVGTKKKEKKKKRDGIPAFVFEAHVCDQDVTRSDVCVSSPGQF